MRAAAHNVIMSEQDNRTTVGGDSSAARIADLGNGATETAVNDAGYKFQNSRRTYVAGKLYVEVHVPFREISLAPTKSMNGEIEVNEPVRVYDTSGPWGDPDFQGNVTQGLPPLREKWIRER